MHCGKMKTKDHFYVSTDPQNKTGVVPWCKECCRDVAMRKDKDGNLHTSTEESVKKVLEYIDKPFLQTVWDASVAQASDLTLGKVKTDPWNALIKNLQMRQYYGLRWRDSDMFTGKIYDAPQKNAEKEKHVNEQAYADYLKNKQDTIRLLGYDPFEKEDVGDQPFLYSQLLGMIDSSEDMSQDQE